METKKWFARQFDFNLNKEDYAGIYERLLQGAGAVKQVTTGLAEEILILQPEGKWSIKEHIGHLSLLEPLWRARFKDIQESKPVLTPTDLENRATTNAGFNGIDLQLLINTFAEERNKTLALLNDMNEQDFAKTSLHPRLQQSMRIIDNAYFVAEHDGHHIQRIIEIINLFNN